MTVEHVHDDIGVIEQNPLAVGKTFVANALTHIDDIGIDTRGNTVDMAITAPRTNDEEIGIIALSTNVDNDGLDRFFVDRGVYTCSCDLFARILFHSLSNINAIRALRTAFHIPHFALKKKV